MLIFKRCDFDALNNAIVSIDWRQCLVGDSVDLNVETFYDKLLEIVDVHVPRTRSMPDLSTRKPWWTTELRRSRNSLRKIRKRYFKSKSTVDLHFLRSMETASKNLLAETYRSYTQNVQESLKQNPAAFWKYVKSLKTSAKIPYNMEFNGKFSSSITNKPNYLPSFFRPSTPQRRPCCFRVVSTVYQRTK